MISGLALGLAALADRYDAFFVDQYGAMHDGAKPYPGAVEALSRLTGSGRPVVVLTNSGKRAAPNIARLASIGFPRDSFTALMSSGEVTWQALRTGAFGPPFGAGGRVCVIGPHGEDYGLGGLGLTLVEAPADAAFLVIAGSDVPATSVERYAAMLAPAAARHVPALCANPDRQMLTATGLQPAAGALAALYESLGGRVVFVGKPHPAIYAQARKAAGNTPARILCIGDSLDHDVDGGARAGCDTALVRTGLMAGLDEAAVRTLIDAAPHKPTYLLRTLAW